MGAYDTTRHVIADYRRAPRGTLLPNGSNQLSEYFV